MTKLKKLKETLSKIETGRVLDVGTRHGEFVGKLQDGLKGYTQIIGVDNDPACVEKARTKFTDERIVFEVQDGAAMTYPDASFDMVCISSSLHHMEKLDQTMDEMMRVLKPGGWFVINEMYRDNQTPARETHVMLHQLAGEIDSLLGEYHGETFTRQALVDFFGKLGLTDTMIFDDFETDPKLVEAQVKKVQKITAKAEKTKDYPQYEEFMCRAKAIQAKFEKDGIDRCTQLIMMGRKPQ